MSNEGDSLFIVASWGTEVAERCYAPFVIGTTAQASDVKSNIFLMMDAVLIAKKGFAKKVKAPGFPPLEELIESFTDEGGKIYVCSNSAAFRGIGEKDVIEGSEIAGAALMVDEILEHKRTVYI